MLQAKEGGRDVLRGGFPLVKRSFYLVYHSFC